LILQIALLAVLLFLSSVFSGSETALFSLKSYQVRRLQSRPSRRSIRVVSLLSDPRHLLVTIVIGNTLVNVAASSIGTEIVAGFVEHGVVGLSVAIMTVLILIFGEIVPKTFAVSHPLRVSLRTASTISAAVSLLAPVRKITDAASDLAERLRLKRAPRAAGHSGEHAAEAVALGHSEGAIDKFEGELLGGIFRIMHLSVQNIMTPRTEVFMLSSDLTLQEAVSVVKSSGYSRIPVFDSEERETIRGVLYAKDLLLKQYSPRLRVTEIARRPVFVPESKPAAVLLKEFATGAAHFAVAIDEHGSFTGVVTLDDILSEVVGGLGEKHQEKHSYVKKSRSRWLVSGRMEIEFFNALLGVSVVDPHAETIAGVVVNHLGRIPVEGELLTLGNLTFRVVEADRRRIGTLEVEKARK
jgi:CBS domain containing-hemolysin-like protein